MIQLTYSNMLADILKDNYEFKTYYNNDCVLEKLEKLGYLEIRGTLIHGDYTVSGFFKVTELGKQYMAFQKL